MMSFIEVIVIPLVELMTCFAQLSGYGPHFSTTDP